MKPTKANRTGQSTAEDVVMTPPHIARMIVSHFQPTGKTLDPAKGEGAFYEALPQPKDWCEISRGVDFFDYENHVDWIITNPPFSIYDRFLEHCFTIADNVVLLVPIAKGFKSMKIQRLVDSYGGLREVFLIGSGTRCGFKVGFPTGALYYQRNYSGPITLSRPNL